MHSDLFSHHDSIFVVCFSIQNFDMSGDEISRSINVIFKEIILSSGLKPCVVISKAASYGFMSLVTVLFQNKWTKKLIFAYAIRIEDWKSANHQIITWFRNWDLLVTRYAGPSSARNFKLTRELYQIRQEPGERITVYHNRMKSI